jgi:hypothetical protein
MCIVEATHVLDCNKDIGKKKAAAAASEEVSRHGQVDEQRWISREVVHYS